VFRTTDEVWTLSEEESAEMAVEFPDFTPIFHAVIQPYVTKAMTGSPGSPGSPAPARETGGPLILSIARMTRQKRLDLLLRAFAHVETKDARLLILGEGEDRKALEALARELGIADRVEMPGYLPDVSRALHEADLFVLSSEYEGLPAAVLEAMAANCPVLSTKCFPSASSLIGETEGCAIIGNTEPATVARQIDLMLKLPRPTALVDVASRYSVPNGMANHVEALRRLLDHAAR
jgi:glycosyltransferase involved in cell wall biosynthesis